MQENNPNTQIFQESKTKLIECQTSHSLTSCFQCPQVLECPIREEYVKNAYSYLNKGEEGEFEF
ncbi:hypothetical protein [Helicobacter brantae]|uniref:Uncharacterized protein n=1 Tax=Helicobacter brantae TaxID=375927 RepID=A0A3D8IZ46_9HELI|nr:hypothetical protein [Helicobacter brantae]RDU70538.1 hypothetical protein CQA58_05035 [Helicobacter brantae]